jgi:hypothetical protein
MIDDVILLDNCVMLSKQPPSSICHLGFLEILKTSENYHKNDVEFIKQILLKSPKNLKITA